MPPPPLKVTPPAPVDEVTVLNEMSTLPEKLMGDPGSAGGARDDENPPDAPPPTAATRPPAVSVAVTTLWLMTLGPATLKLLSPNGSAKMEYWANTPPP